MILAETATVAFAVTAVVAVLARFAGALTTGGAIAGAVVGVCVSAGFGLPGLAVLGTFFVVGTLATRIGWERKKARGTAEAGEGRRDAKRVLGKGGVAGLVALLASLGFQPLGPSPEVVFAGSIAAALADTLGTEIGLLWPGRVLRIPQLRLVAAGTPGAVSWLGTAASAAGAALVALVAAGVGLYVLSEDGAKSPLQSVLLPLGVTTAGFAASLTESLAVGCGLRAPGFVRNVLTTLVGAVLARGTYAIR
jgi:uncharacterized protein (TIGR00297 family)